MIKIKTRELEKRLGMRLLENCKSVGIDTASRTGWAYIESKNGETIIDFGFININSKDKYFKFDRLIESFDDLIKHWNCNVIIEDTFFSRNANTLKVLSRIGMIVYVLCKIHKHDAKFILPSVARSSLKFNGTAKKEIVHKQVEEKLKLNVEDVDIVDAIILALCGQINDNILGF